MDLGASSFWRQSMLGGPSLELSFLSGSLDSRVTFTRASTAWAYNSSGTLTSYATNTPRFDYDPVTLAAKGLLIEEARTNSLRNSSMTGAAAGTPGTLPTNWTAAATASGITRQIIGTGAVNGLPYIDIKYSGTAVAGDTVLFLEMTTGAATVNATTWTSSAHIALVGGTLTNVTPKQGLRFRAAAGASIGTQIFETAIVPTSTLTRYERTATAADATVAFVVSSLTLTMASGAVDLTLRIAAPQLELGAFATSNILTTSATVTRAVDVCSMLTSAFGFNATTGTIYAEFQRIGLPSANLPRTLSFSDGTTNNLIELVWASPNDQFAIVTGGVAQGPVSLGALGGTSLVKAAGAYATNDSAAVLNGGTVGTDLTVTIPTVDRLQIGNRSDLTAARQFSGYVRGIKYWPTRKTNAELQTLTT